MNSILHIGNIAGVPQELARAQRKLGFKSDVISFDHHPFEYEIDLYYPTKLPSYLRYSRYVWSSFRFIEKMFNLLENSTKYDVFHFHFSSILPFGMDIPIWKMLKKKIIIHHHGSDIRYKGELQMYSKFADKIFVSTPDILEWSPSATWMPNPISLDRLSYLGVEHKDESEEINIVHAPSNRAIKGTEYVIKAVTKLRNEGYKINFVLVENMSHNKAIEYYKKADIIIDWINPKFGIYGMFSIENMAIGKPVICNVKQKFIDMYFKDLPIFNSLPLSLAEDLRILLEDYNLRKELGEKGRKYVEQMHDANKIAKQLIELYKSI